MTRTPNRRIVLGGMIALQALALARIAQAQPALPSRTGPIAPEDFMALSQHLTGHDALSPTLGGRIFAVLADTGQSQALQALYDTASDATPDVTADQGDLLRRILHGWYLGRIEIEGRTHLTGYEHTLMGRVTTDILPLRSFCGGTMGFWASPPDVGPLSLREARP